MESGRIQVKGLTTQLMKLSRSRERRPLVAFSCISSPPLLPFNIPMNSGKYFNH